MKRFGSVVAVVIGLSALMPVVVRADAEPQTICIRALDDAGLATVEDVAAALADGSATVVSVGPCEEPSGPAPTGRSIVGSLALQLDEAHFVGRSAGTCDASAFGLPWASIAEGAQIVALDGGGTVIGVGTLGAGAVAGPAVYVTSEGDSWYDRCAWPFAIDVPDAAFYRVVFGSLADGVVAGTDIDAADHAFEIVVLGP